MPNESRIETAPALFKEGYNCSQAVFAAHAPLLGVDRQSALKIACSFGAGMGRCGGTCGAISGALMVVGLKYGNKSVADKEAKENTYAKTTEVLKQFQERNHSILCKELIGCDLSTPEGMKSAKDRRIHETICLGFVKDASEILETILGT